MVLYNQDVESFARYMTDNLDPNYEVEAMEHELKRDHRRNGIQGDIFTRYNEYKDFTSSRLARDVERTVNLLPSNGEEVAVKDLRNALVHEWSLDPSYADKVIREAGSNDIRVSARHNAMNKSVEEIRLRKITS